MDRISVESDTGEEQSLSLLVVTLGRFKAIEMTAVAGGNGFCQDSRVPLQAEFNAEDIAGAGR